MLRPVTAVIVGAALLGGCAKRAEDIRATYVSPMYYDHYNCEQIAAEAQRLSARASQAMGAQDQRASNDAAAVAIGLVLFWPALLFVRGNGMMEADLADLKGYMEAIEQASIQKQCGLSFQRPEPPKRPQASPHSQGS